MKASTTHTHVRTSTKTYACEDVYTSVTTHTHVCTSTKTYACECLLERRNSTQRRFPAAILDEPTAFAIAVRVTEQAHFGELAKRAEQISHLCVYVHELATCASNLSCKSLSRLMKHVYYA